MNVTLLAGRLSRPPEERALPSGDRLVAYDITVANPGDRADSVPVVWHDPPAAALKVGEGDDVVVVGRVRRRFFRSGGGLQSRTEVVADAVLSARQTKRCRTLVDKAVARALQPAPAGEDQGNAGLTGSRRRASTRSTLPPSTTNSSSSGGAPPSQ